MVVPIFFLVLFGIIDLGRAYFTHLTLQHATRQAGRFAVTGQKLEGMSREASIRFVAAKAAAGFPVDNILITSCCSTNSGNGRAGGPSDTVTISMAVDLQIITPMIGRFFGEDGIYQFRVSSTFLNEPFPL